MGDAKQLLDRVDVEFPASEFFHDPDSFPVGQNAEQSGKFFGRESAVGHESSVTVFS